MAITILGVVGISSYLIMSKLENSRTSSSHISFGQSRAFLESLIAQRIDCQKTLQSVADPVNLCKSQITNDSVLTASGSPLLQVYRKALGGSVPLTDSNGMVGGWKLRVSCSTSQNSLVIRAAYPQGNGFLKDLDGPLNFNHPRALLAPRGGLKICESELGGSPSSSSSARSNLLANRISYTATTAGPSDVSIPKANHLFCGLARYESSSQANRCVLYAPGQGPASSTEWRLQSAGVNTICAANCF